MDGELSKLIQVWITAILSGCYCYAVSRTTTKGFFRLLLILPVATFFAVAPYSILLYRHFSGITWFFLTWLGISKLLLFSFDMGPLSAAHHLPFIHFVSTLLFPIKIRTGHGSGSGLVESGPSWALLATKVVAFGCVIEGYKYREGMSFWGRVGLYSTHLYLSMEVLLAVTGALVWVLLRIRLDPRKDMAYLSSSLQEFWGKRWNSIVSDILRQTVHNPICSLGTPFIGKKTSTLVGIFASFLVSGLMHEWLYTILTRLPPTWEVTCFFVLHGACLAIETTIKDKRRLHPFVSGSLKVGFVVITAAWLLFPPLLRNNIHEKFVEEFVMFESFVTKKVLWEGLFRHHNDTMI